MKGCMETKEHVNKPITDCNNRPEGLTPLIFWEWLQAGRRSIEHNPDARSGVHWNAFERGSRVYHHQYAGGLAAQLQPMTSFREDVQ